MFGWGFTAKTALSDGDGLSPTPAQRGCICNSPGIPSDWTEGPSHGSGPRGTAGGCVVWTIGTISPEVGLKNCVKCIW